MRIGFLAAAALIAMASTETSAQVLNLSGPYRCVQGCIEGLIDQPAFITQHGWDLSLVNEAGMPSRAWIDRPGHIWADSWHEGAVYSVDGMTIQFDRGTVWQRDLAALTPVVPVPSVMPVPSCARPSGRRAPDSKRKSCSGSGRKSARRYQCVRRPLERGHSHASWQLRPGISLRRADHQRQRHHGFWRIHRRKRARLAERSGLGERFSRRRARGWPRAAVAYLRQWYVAR